MFRRAHQHLCRGWLDARAVPVPAHEMSRSAVIFSPHYDDETLGVGGTIIRKRAAGAAVRIVFMTDGSRSHAAFIDSRRLSEIRRQEALNAAESLGVPHDCVTFLEFPETRLSGKVDELIHAVGNVLLASQAEEVYIPAAAEPLIWSADHNVTTSAVCQALRRHRLKPMVYEYLVWYWFHWPWVPLSRGSDVRRLLRLTARARFGTCLGSGLNAAVSIAEVLAQKRAALEQYRSQMTRLDPTTAWPVLSDVGGGEFLGQFFQNNEYFKRYVFG